MSNFQLIASLTLYILSVVAALVLTITAKKRGTGSLKGMLILHMFLVLLFAMLFLSGNRNIYIHLSFLFFFCSGILLSGLLLRSEQSLFMKIYSALFLSSIIFFLISPSRTIRFITFSHTEHQVNRWNIVSNYFLEEEQLLLAHADSTTSYKITRQFGVFHKTLARDISFGNRVDSIKVLEFNENQNAIIRGYINENSSIFGTCDSMDISVPFVASKNTIIQKREKK
jgi:hypothetical protein